MNVNSNYKVFDNNKITKYFRNQSLTKDLTVSNPFVDNFFPANKSSISGYTNNNIKLLSSYLNKEYEVNKIVWKRIDEVINSDEKNISLFGDHLIVDMANISSADYYFFNIINSLSRHPTQILNIFKQKEINKLGYYEIILFIDGEWQIILIDDLVPMWIDTNELLFCKPHCEKGYIMSVWFLLLQKAWSKVNECYSNTFAFYSPLELFKAITSLPYQVVSTKSIEDNILWELIKTNLSTKNLIFTSKSNDIISNYGLKENFQYMITDVKEIQQDDQNIKLVLIKKRNGDEWNGVWSDKSSAWKENKIKQNELFDEFELMHFIDFDEFIVYFPEISICNVMNEKYLSSLNLDFSPINSTLLFQFSLVKPTNEFDICLCTKNWRFNRTLLNINTKYPIFMILLNYDKNQNYFTIINSGYTLNENDIHLKCNSLKKGDYYLWMYCNYAICSDPKPNYFNLRFISNIEINLKSEFSTDRDYTFISKAISNIVCNESRLDSENKLKIKHRTNIKNTGLGYLYINNKNGKSLELNINENLIENMFILNRDEKRLIPAHSEYIVLAIVKDTSKKYDFFINYDLEELVYNIYRKDDQKTIFKHLDISNYFLPDIRSTNLEFMNEKFLKQEEKFILTQKLFPDQYKLLMKYSINDYDKDLKWVIKEEYKNGYYIGQIDSTNKRCGLGIYTWNTGEKYFGFWENDIFHLKGTQLDTNDKIVYEGEYMSGSKHGKGLLNLPNGDSYLGWFENNIFKGVGTYQWNKTKNELNGDFAQNRLDGEGVLTKPDGTTIKKIFDFNLS